MYRKKLLSVSLALVFTFTSLVPASASELTVEENPIYNEETAISYDENTGDTSDREILSIEEKNYVYSTLTASFQIDYLVKEGCTPLFSSGNESVVTVSQTGLVTIVGPGTTDIYVQVLDEETNRVVTETLDVTIQRGVPEIYHSESDYYLHPGEGTQTHIRCDYPFTLASSDTSVFTIDANGYLTMNQEPSQERAYVIVECPGTDRYDSNRLEIPVYVNRQDDVTKVDQTITASDLSIVIGSNKAVDATAMSALSYSSSDPSVASVTEDGVVTGNKSGTATITITAEETNYYHSAVKEITVRVNKKSQTISAKSMTIAPTAKNKSIGANAKTKLTYKSSNTSVVTVNSKGQLTAKKAGTTKITITAAASGTYNKATKVITITVARLSQTITAKNVSMYPTQKNKSIGATSKTSRTYKSSNTSVVTIDRYGKMTAKKSGTAKITITAAGTKTYKSRKKVITVTVKRLSQTVTARQLTLQCGERGSLQATSKTTRSYVSLNTKVATVSSSGTVTAKRSGVAKITVKAAGTKKYAGKSKSVYVYVSPDVSGVSKTTVNGTDITLTAKQCSGASGYEIRYSDKEDMSDAKTVSISSTTTTITGLSERTIYYFQVRSYVNAGGEKLYSDWCEAYEELTDVAVTPTDPTPTPDAPTITPTPSPTPTETPAGEYGHYETYYYGTDIDAETLLNIGNLDAYDSSLGSVTARYESRVLCNKCGKDITDPVYVNGVMDSGIGYHYFVENTCESGYHSERVEMSCATSPGKSYQKWVVDAEPHEGMTWHDAVGHYDYVNRSYVIKEWEEGEKYTKDYCTYTKYACRYVIDVPGYWE